MLGTSAPSALQPGSTLGPRDEPFEYVKDIILTALQVTTESIDLQPDADFIARALFIATSTGPFKIRWSDSRQYFTSSNRIDSRNLSSDGAAPYPIVPELPLPANGRIGIDIENLSGAGNTIQLVFRGVKRFRG
jgi:hypothetical protein